MRALNAADRSHTKDHTQKRWTVPRHTANRLRSLICSRVAARTLFGHIMCTGNLLLRLLVRTPLQALAVKGSWLADRKPLLMPRHTKCTPCLCSTTHPQHARSGDRQALTCLRAVHAHAACICIDAHSKPRPTAVRSLK